MTNPFVQLWLIWESGGVSSFQHGKIQPPGLSQTKPCMTSLRVYILFYYYYFTDYGFNQKTCFILGEGYRE